MGNDLQPIGGEMSDQTTVWVVGKVLGNDSSHWELMGVMAMEAEAIAACRTTKYYIGPAVLGELLPDQRVPWPGAYYPRLQKPPAMPPPDTIEMGTGQ